MHPLINDAHTLSINEIEDKILKLNKAYHICQNQETRQQIILALDTYKIALQDKQLEQKKLENENSDDSGLDSLIKVS